MQQNNNFSLKRLQDSYLKKWGYLPLANNYNATREEFEVALKSALEQGVELDTIIPAKNAPNNVLLKHSLKNSTSGTKVVSRVEATAKGRKDTRATSNMQALLNGGNQEANSYSQVVSEKNQIKTVQSNKRLGKTRRAVIVRQNQERRRSPLLKIANFASYVAVGLVAVFLGIFAGNMYIAAHSRISYDFDEKDYLPNWEQTYNNTFGKVLPQNASAVDAYVTAEYMLKADSNKLLDYTMHGSGYVSAKVMGIVQKQLVTKYMYKQGNEFMIEGITDGLIPAAEKTIYNLSDKTLKSYQTKAVTTVDSVSSANYAKEPTKVYDTKVQDNYDAFRKEYGITPYDVFPYLVSSKTVDSESKATKVDNGWQYTIVLNNLTGVMNYVYYMMHISGLNREPTFYELKLTFVVDDNYRLQRLNVYEKYQIYYMGLPADCNSESIYTVSY